ncbi:MAG: hypothetical protein NC405_05865 [Odoribacter sp.]|nr:hypothetical protein [Odoribacter sp.]
MERFKQWFKNPQVWGFFVSLAVLAAVSIAFFYPDNFDGNSLRQADMQQGAANGQEGKLFYEETGEQALWTDALFGGMPTFQISPTYPSNRLFTWMNTAYGLGLPAPSNLLFMMMAGFLILLFAMKMRWYYALIGAIAWGFSSYFVIIIGAGHIWKFVTLSYIPPTIAGLVLTYRGRYIVGSSLTALFAMLQLNANHPQMSYYFAFVMLALVIAWFIEALKTKTVRRWTMASVFTLAAGALAIGANLPSLYNTYEYSKETKRAQSELTPLTQAAGGDASSASKPTGGMPREQIVGWSYGQSESFSLLVPNIKGGASARPEKGNMVFNSLDRLDEARQYDNQATGALLPYMPQYFNDSEGTNGPVYVGAAVCLLFLLGCFIIKGPVKWALLVMSVVSLLLAWGENFASLTDLFIYNFPLYNKFRAVESILVIAEFTMPLLAIMALAKVFTTPDALKVYSKPMIISAGICIVICLAAWLTPGVFGDAITTQDQSTAQALASQVVEMGRQYGYSEGDLQGMVYQYSLSNPANAEAIKSLRYGMLRADGLRSLFFILVVCVAFYCYSKKWCSKTIAIAAVGLSILIDLYTVDKRYVSNDSFVTVTASTPEFVPDDIDSFILRDTSHYRVLDIPGFYKADRSFFHNMIGGYHAAKLNRYEDLIQRQLGYVTQTGYFPELREDSVRASYPEESRAMVDKLAAVYRILDMLNTRYIITGEQDSPLAINPSALGNAWLVSDIKYVENADAEMQALETLDPSREAVADARFATILGNAGGSLMPGDTIKLVSYTPNKLTYHSNTQSPAIGVFSEIWFPWGWKATIDGQNVPLGRVNYVLRALAIPEGSHDITMTFDPDSLHITGNIAYASVSLIYMLLLAAMFIEYRRIASSGKKK